MKKHIFLFGTAAALSAFAPLGLAQEVEVKAEVDKPKATTRTEVKTDKDLEVKADASLDVEKRDRVLKSNKASGIIGMEVRNKENEKLGEVKDLVMDLGTGRLSYAVLSVGGFLGIGEKLIALPPGAMKASTEGDHLILDADKAKIQAAPGFAATAWPAASDPEINRYWTDIRATGAPARSETSTKIYTDADGDKKVKVEAEKKD